MLSKPIIEGLIYRVPNIRIPFETLGILSSYRQFSSIKHEELNYILNYFEKEPLNFIGVYAAKQTVIIFSNQIGTYNQMRVLIIQGENADFILLGKVKATRFVQNQLTNKEYMPNGTVTKIILVDKYDNKNTYGRMYSKWLINTWVEGNGLDLYNSEPRPFRTDSVLVPFLSDIYENAISKQKERRK